MYAQSFVSGRSSKQMVQLFESQVLPKTITTILHPSNSLRCNILRSQVEDVLSDDVFGVLIPWHYTCRVLVMHLHHPRRPGLNLTNPGILSDVEEKIRQTSPWRFEQPHLLDVPVPAKLVLVLEQEIARPSPYW